MRTALDNFNVFAVSNGGTPPQFTVTVPTYITFMATYHWNDGKGAPTPGTISLKAEGGTVYGPFQTTIETATGGVPANWVCTPNVTIPAGTYTVIDSDPSTWSQNDASGGQGFVRVQGIQ